MNSFDSFNADGVMDGCVFSYVFTVASSEFAFGISFDENCGKLMGNEKLLDAIDLQLKPFRSSQMARTRVVGDQF